MRGHHRRRGEAGNALIEFALGSTMFLMILIGVTQFAFAAWQYNMMSRLAQEGARWAAVRGAKGSSPASATQVETYVQGRNVGHSVTVNTYTVNPATNACTTTAVDPSALNRGSALCVKVSSTFNAINTFVPIRTMTLSSTAQMRVAR